MEDAVQSTPETTSVEAPATSEVSQDTSTTTESTTAVSDSGSEPAKTPDTIDDDALVQEASGQVKSTKGQNRVQELANRVKEYKAQLERLQNAEAQVSQARYSQPQAPIPDPAYQPYDDTRDRLIILTEKQRLFEEQRAFAEAERQYPQLDRNSPDYNADFDDAVYAMTKATGQSPTEAAKKVSNLLKLAETKGQANEARSIASKIQDSGSVQKRTSPDLSAKDAAYQKAREGLKRTGSVDALEQLLKVR